MDFKIQQAYPSPSHGLTPIFNSLTYAPNIHSLILYGEQKPSPSNAPQHPKKKIAFKATKSQAQITIDRIPVFSLRQGSWQIKQCKGKIPTPRTYFNTIHMGSCMILQGGQCGDKPLNDIYALNTETWLWKKLFILQNPPASLKPNIFCKIDEANACLIDADKAFWILHIEDVKWELSSNELPGSVWEKTHLRLPENPLFCLTISKTDILVIGAEQTFRINLIQKQIMQATKFNVMKLLWTPQQESKEKPIVQSIDLSRAKSFRMNNSIILVNTNKIVVLLYTSVHDDSKDQGNDGEQIMILKTINGDHCMQLDFVPHCFELVTSDLRMYAIDSVKDKNGKLYSIELILDLDKDEEEEQSGEAPLTTRIIQSSNENQGIITEEDYRQYSQQSMLLNEGASRVTKVGQAQQEGQSPSSSRHRELKETAHFYEDKQHPTSHQQKLRGSGMRQQRQSNNEGRDEERGEISVSSQIAIDEGSQSSEVEESDLLKENLSIVLTHEHLKRRLLEERVGNLEEIIKKSERFVLLLCKYGNKNAKRKHIEQVKLLRQKLEHTISKEAYYRQEMAGSSIPISISRAVDHTIATLK